MRIVVCFDRALVMPWVGDPLRGRVELAELTADRVGVLVEADGRATVGQRRGGRLEVFPTLLGDAGQRLAASLVGHRVVEAVTLHPRDVVHRHGGDRLDARVDLRSAQREAAAAADADHTDTLPGYERTGAEVVDGRAEVFDEQVGRRHVPRLATAESVVRRVEGQHHEAAARQDLRVQAGALLLHTAVRVADDQCRALRRRVEVLVGVDVRGDLDAVAVLEGHVGAGHVLVEFEDVVISHCWLFPDEGCSYIAQPGGCWVAR